MSPFIFVEYYEEGKTDVLNKVLLDIEVLKSQGDPMRHTYDLEKSNVHLFLIELDKIKRDYSHYEKLAIFDPEFATLANNKGYVAFVAEMYSGEPNYFKITYIDEKHLRYSESAHSFTYDGVKLLTEIANTIEFPQKDL